MNKSFRHLLTSLQDTHSIASMIASHLQTGDILCLKGTLGSGKTTFSQALINAYMGKEMHVTSPTFTLVQLYESKHKTPIWHCDFYRLEHENELDELGLEDAFDHAITIIEWPEIAQNYLPAEQLKIDLRLVESTAPSQEDMREITLTLSPALEERFGKDITQWQITEK